MAELLSFYVLPSEDREEGAPPLAVLTNDVVEPGQPISGELVVWSRDIGCWMKGATPLPPPLSDALTEHARNLGVEW